MQTVCLYSPFPTRATLVGAPLLCATCARRGGCTISSPLPRGVCATPPRCANGECRAAHKGTPSPFRPCPRSGRTGRGAQDPLPHPPLSRPRLCINGGSFAPQPGTRARARGTAPRPLRAAHPSECGTQTGGGPPPPFCSFPARANGVRRMRRPNRARDRGRKEGPRGWEGARSRRGKHPSLHLRAGMPFPLSPCPHARTMGPRPKVCEPGGRRRGAGAPTHCVCARPHVRSACTTPAPHLSCAMHGGLRKVGCRGRACGMTCGVVLTPPSRRCANGQQRRSNARRPRPLHPLKWESDGGGAQKRCPPAPFPSSRAPCTPFARNEGPGGVQTGGGGLSRGCAAPVV